MREGGNLLSQAHQLSGRVFSRVLKEFQLDAINPSQGRILYALWKKNGISQRELAELTKLDKSSLALTLDRLEKDGWIERKNHPADLRKKIVYATNKTTGLYEHYEKASLTMTEVFYHGLSEAERDKFEETLRTIIRNLENTDIHFTRTPSRDPQWE